MRTYIGIVLLLCFCSLALQAQEEFQARLLVSSPYREGFPSFSPNGNFMVFQRTERIDTTGQNGLWRIAISYPSLARQIYSGVAEHPRWSPDGKLIVFDADTGRSIKMLPVQGGDPISFLPDTFGIVNGGLPCWSPDGLKVAFIAGSTLSLCVFDSRKGSAVPIFHEPGMVPLPGGWTPDGDHILIALMDRESRKSTIWKISADGKQKTQITGHRENFYRYLALSPDGALLVYASLEDGYLGLYIMPATGGASLPLAVSKEAHNDGPCWSPDGKMVAFSSGQSGNGDIYVVELDPEEVAWKLRELSE
jgi:Tol biopolymer transport system component